MKSLPKNRRGFTLVEMLTYMALFGMILSVIYSIYYQFSRTLSAAEITMLKERSIYHAVQRMRDDLHRNTTILKSFGPFRAADKCLILRISKSDGSENQVVIYRLDEPRKALIRYGTTAKESGVGISSLTVANGINNFDFSLEPENPNLLKVSIGVRKGAYGTLHSQPMTFYTTIRSE